MLLTFVVNFVFFSASAFNHLVDFRPPLCFLICEQTILFQLDIRQIRIQHSKVLLYKHHINVFPRKMPFAVNFAHILF